MRPALRRRHGWAVGLAGGAAAALAHPPFGLTPGLLGFAAVLWSLDTADPERPLRSTFVRGWAAGFGYLFVSTFWIAEPFFVDAAAHAWQAPFAVALVPGLIGLLWGGAGLAYAVLKPPGPGRVLVFAAAFAVFEWLRGHMLTGFPWDLPGEAWRAGSAMSQAAAVIGAYGLSLITLAVAAAPALRFDRPRPARAWLAQALAALALIGVWSWGAARLARARPDPQTGPLVRVVQPNLPELARVSEADVTRAVQRYARLTALPGAPDVVVWPEGAVPDALNDYLAPGTWTEAAIRDALKPGATLLTGGYRWDAPAPGSTAPRAFNTLLALRREGADLRAVAVYDKHHLVPFGEYLPAEGVLAPLGLRQLVSVRSPFTPGPSPRPIAPPGVPPVQPLICYESLFPGYMPGLAHRPAWIVNVSDDAWFGRISGPQQHFNLASYRAIEEGLPIVRATPVGVSGVIDAYGRPRATLGLGREGVVDARLPPALAPTPYARWKDGPFWLLVLLSLSPALQRPMRGAFSRRLFTWSAGADPRSSGISPRK